MIMTMSNAAYINRNALKALASSPIYRFQPYSQICKFYSGIGGLIAGLCLCGGYYAANSAAYTC
jgi:hypothetical protein